MYTNEQKMKAVELYIKYNHRATQVSRELGYPHSNFIARWYKEYLRNGTFRTKYERQNKYVNAGMKIMKNAGKKMTATPGLPPPVY